MWYIIENNFKFYKKWNIFCVIMFYFFFYLYMKKDKIDVIRKVIDINLIIYFECYFGNCDGNIKLFF